MRKQYFVYILTNYKNNVFYIGITSDLPKRIHIHKYGLVKGFTSQYKVWKLVYVEEFSNVNEAIESEKMLKNWHREWKINLIKSKNPCFEKFH